MYLIGIDVSKYKHDCFIATEAGQVIKDSFTFTNDAKGFNTLLEVLHSLDPAQTKRIGLEATGHYGYNLKVFLDRHGFDFMEFNPYLVKKLSTGLSLRKTKTDSVDAKLLSMILLSVEYKVYPVQSYHIYDLKSLTRYYKDLVKKHSKELVVLTNLLDSMFPEFKAFFNNRFTKTALYLLEHYQTPEKMARMTLPSYEKLQNISRGHFSYAQFIHLKNLAKNTIGSTSPYLEFKLESSLRVIRTFNQEIQELESRLKDWASRMNSVVFSIHGIGVISALSIIAEYGSFDSFDSPAKMLSFAGLEPSVNQSGTSNTSGHMVKRGSGYLRETIMNVAVSFMMHNPTIYEYYLKKRNEGKSHRVALSHVAKKLIRILFHLVKSNVSFLPSKLV
ncbi:MAG: IS110 family transposase [Candidatus Izemoplasmatales bacterium]|nr:IS110 family transposase [bacterium]MDZ4196689.1 IS110 family transposase [Candidatus Izemoplasmatales bacterium]